MLKEIKDRNGNQLSEPVERFVLEFPDGRMIEVADFREATAAVTGTTYLDCESAETEWHVRTDSAKKIGLMILATEEGARTIVYDERIGKIPYSYTDPNPDYDIPEDPELIRVESEFAFIGTLAKIEHIIVWEKTENDYQDIRKVRDLDAELEADRLRFADRIQRIPLHKRLGE